ncbi:MAG: hypothetical protein K1060chlam2_00076 [Chlamydiae bacterium]|nr:hypothetical protein [Chlamydiota bacterium]
MFKKSKTLLTVLVLFLALGVGVTAYRASYKPKVFDCFLFYNEFDILEIRLEEMYDKVDKFILVESTRTFQNKSKPLFFKEKREHFAKYADKIIHVVVDEFPEFSAITSDNYWEVEIFQRNQIGRGLKACHPDKRDIVIISDVDEIIRREKIDEITRLIAVEDNDLVFGEFELYTYFLNRKSANYWQICLATSWGNFSKYIRTAQALRDLGGFSKGHAYNGFSVLEKIKRKHPKKKWAFARTNKTGWHFSSVGGLSKVLQKLESCSHVSANTESNRDVERIKKSIDALEYCEINDQFPEYILKNEERFRASGLIDSRVTVFE